MVVDLTPPHSRCLRPIRLLRQFQDRSYRSDDRIRVLAFDLFLKKLFKSTAARGTISSCQGSRFHESFSSAVSASAACSMSYVNFVTRKNIYLRREARSTWRNLFTWSTHASYEICEASKQYIPTSSVDWTEIHVLTRARAYVRGSFANWKWTMVVDARRAIRFYRQVR